MILAINVWLIIVISRRRLLIEFSIQFLFIAKIHCKINISHLESGLGNFSPSLYFYPKSTNYCLNRLERFSIPKMDYVFFFCNYRKKVYLSTKSFCYDSTFWLKSHWVLIALRSSNDCQLNDCIHSFAMLSLSQKREKIPICRIFSIIHYK